MALTRCTVNISTTSNIGYTASLPIGMPLAAQTSVTSANQIRFVSRRSRTQFKLPASPRGSLPLLSEGNSGRNYLKQMGPSSPRPLLSIQGPLWFEDSFTITPVVLDPGYYYFAWSVDNATAKLAGSGTGTVTGLFNRVAASPGQATCTEP